MIEDSEITLKINMIFRLFDVDNNGKIDENDFKYLSNKLAEVRGWKTYDPEHEPYDRMYMNIWRPKAFTHG